MKTIFVYMPHYDFDTMKGRTVVVRQDSDKYKGTRLKEGKKVTLRRGKNGPERVGVVKQVVRGPSFWNLPQWVVDAVPLREDKDTIKLKDPCVAFEVELIE